MPEVAVKNSRRQDRFIALVLFAAFVVASTSAANAATKKIILDTDPGTDDAMALMLALNSPELDVRAVTVVPGNVTAQQGLENALRMLSLANRCDIPVAAGAQHPLLQKLITAQFWHGKNGIADIELPPSKCHVDARFGPDLIIEMVHAAPHEITLVPIGPLTNIALAVEKDPSIVPLVKEVILMGGSISGGNVNAAAEANIYGDPEAARIVFDAGWPLTMVGLDVANKTLFTKKHLDRLSQTHGPINDFIYKIASFTVDLGIKYGAEGAAMYDQLAVGVAIDSTLVTAPAMRVDIETRGALPAEKPSPTARATSSTTCCTATIMKSRALIRSSPTPRSAPKSTPTAFLKCSFQESVANRFTEFQGVNTSKLSREVESMKL